MTKKELKNSYLKIKEAIEKKDINIANSYVTGLNNGYISDIICVLRLNGYDVQSPSIITDGYTYNYELLAEVARQLYIYLHPIKHWVKNNWIQLALLLCSIIALVISIIALFN